MGELLFLPMTVHMNESSMANILSFTEVSNIAGVHVKIDTSKGKVINFHMQDRWIIYFRACSEGLFNTKLDDPILVTNPINTSINTYYFSIHRLKSSGFSLISKLKD